MNIKTITLISIFTLTDSLYAMTKIYDDGENLNASITSEEEAKSLYDGLNIAPIEGRSGKAKFFFTNDKKASIYCRKSSIPIGVQYACTLSINHIEPKSSDTPVFVENGFLHASVNDQQDAESLFNLLNFQLDEARSGKAKFFYTDDRKAAVYCSMSTITAGIPYGCRVSIEAL